MPQINPSTAENQVRNYINELANSAPGVAPNPNEGTQSSSNIEEPLDQFESLAETQRRKMMMETFLLNQKEKTNEISRYFQLLTNISKQNHDTLNRIASNIRV